MISLPTIPVRFCPSKETAEVLNNRPWICSYSGGKDSTSLVTWIEWLRRLEMVKVKAPRLVLSDTKVEYPFLRGIADRIMAALCKTGWECEVVTPKINQRLYNRIFGIGNTPVHPGGQKMRWCTRATKIDPMKGFSKTLGPDILALSGVRWGESGNRDKKLSAGGCSAGGECGLPEPGEGVYGPIIAWKVCKVIGWLNGECDGVKEIIPDLLPAMAELVSIYEVKHGQTGFWKTPPTVSALRFGCIGCPAITNEKITTSRRGREHPRWQHLRRIHTELWPALYLRKNRCVRLKTQPLKTQLGDWSPSVGYGPIRMEARKFYFGVLLEIQRDAGVTLVTPEDEAFIRNCWERKIYPRGWSEEDELVQPPEERSLFSECSYPNNT